MSPGTDLQRLDPRSWMVRFGVVSMTGVVIGVVAAGLPAGRSGFVVVGLLAVACVLWAVGLDRRVTRPRVLVPVLVALGLAGAALDLLQTRGPAFVVGYMALVGLALRTSRRTALIAGVPVLAALAVVEARGSRTPGAAVLSIVPGAGFLFAASAFAAVNRDARARAEQLLAEQALLAAARQEAAALAERARLARELHDILAHTLAGLGVQLETARLLAQRTGADPRLIEQLSSAQGLAREGMAGARQAVGALRGEELPGPQLLPRLVEEVRARTGLPVEYEVRGVARRLSPEAGLALYRGVQEALTNVCRYAGNGARACVELDWGERDVTLNVTDSGGDGVAADLPSGGFGLPGMAERAALLGGELTAGPVDGGFAVRLRLPVLEEGGTP